MSKKTEPKPKSGETRVVYCRFRRVKNSDKVLDAWDYGYDAWRLVFKK